MNEIILINGPNMKLLGQRQVKIYGRQTLNDIILNLKKLLPPACNLNDFQNNSEGEIVNFLNAQYLSHMQNKSKVIGIIINAASYTHTSIAIRDALEVFYDEKVKIYEVHLTNIFKRENFRSHSYISTLADGMICGFGSVGYEVALKKILENLSINP